MKDKKVCGSVSLFLAMIFLFVITVITTTIISVRTHIAKTRIATATALSVDSLFAKYDAEVFDEFGVLLFDGAYGKSVLNKEKITNDILEYLKSNLSTGVGVDMSKIKLEGVNLKNVESMTSKSGLLWMDSAVDFEKYAKGVNEVANLLNFEKEEEKYEVIENIIDRVTTISEIISNIREQIKILAKYIDGVNFTGNVMNDITESYFVKRYITSINDTYDVKVSTRIAHKLVNPITELENLKNIIGKNAYTEKINWLIGINNKIIDLCKKVEEKCRFINNEILIYEDGISGIKMYVNDSKEILGDELTNNFNKDFDEMKDYKEELADSVCDIDKMSATVNYNKLLLVEINQKLTTAGTKEKLEEIQKLYSLYSHEGLNINYSVFDIKKGDSSLLSRLKKIFREGILGIVVPSKDTISKRKFEVSNLASAICNIGGSNGLLEGCSLATRSAKKLLYNEYIMDHFNSFTDRKDGAALNYEVEYIIGGKDNDKDNLYTTVKKLANIRSGINLAYLLTDTEKKQNAEELSRLMFSWTNSEAIIISIKYCIMYLWAYSEALADVKALLSDMKVALFKNKNIWQVEYADFLTLNIRADKENYKTGFDYETHLRALLLINTEGWNSAYTMDLVELWKIAKGNKGFRMKNQVFGLAGEILYRVGNVDRYYEYTFGEAY